MLWDRYSLVCSNPSDFFLEKWKNKLTPCNFSLFWASNALSPLTKSVTQQAKSQHHSWYMRKERCHHSFPYCKKRFPVITFGLLLWRSGTQVLKEKKRSFERILKYDLHRASSLWFRTSWILRSSLLGSNIHLTHDILNHTYPPMPLNIGSPPMGKERKNCISYPNSIKIILESLEARWS